MQNSLRKMLARMFADKKRQRRIVAVVCVLSVLVTTTVFTELMQPVITMTPDPVCGQAEHAHGADCFANQLACGVEESEEHAHGDGCYKSILICGKSEHAHTEKCYPEKVEEKKVTVIESTEAPATEAPAAEPTEAPAVMTLSEDEPTEAPATEAPVTEEPTEAPATEAPVTEEATAMSETEPAVEATAEPVVEPTAEPVVEATAEPTVEATEEPVVEPTAVPAPTVAVTAVSAEKVFVGQTVTWTVEASDEAELTYYIADESGAEIVSGALDVDASYISWLADRAGAFTLTVTAANETGSASANGSVTVEASEALVAAALADQLYCFAGEEITFRFAYSGGVEPASVSIAVYQDGQVLTELTEFAETVAVTPANLGEKVTTVTAEITVTDSLGSTVTGVCEIPCAVRTRETESDWEKSTRVDLTGEWPEDLIAVAETQLGYEESEINFIVNDEGERQGYTRYGQWYGSSYAEWCAMFVSFDLNYAEIPEKYFPREANCEKWISALKSRGLYESAEGDYEPQVGDLVFFDWEDNDESDHVGIITAVTDKKIETIEGNADKGVRRRDYDRDDEVLYGYGCVLEAYEKYLRDELDLDLEAGVGAQAIVTAETANLRAEADADSELVAQLAIDTVVDVLAAEQNRAEIWYQVAAGELTGYIRSDMVETDYIAVEALVPVVADYDVGNMMLTAEESGIEGLVPNEYYASTSSSSLKMNENYAVEASVVFIPVDSEGNELTDVVAPAAVRTTLNYTGKGLRTEFKNTAICPEVDQCVGAENVYSVSLHITTDGVETEAPANYVSIFSLWNSTPFTGCYFTYGETYGTCVNYLYNPDAYFVVRYIYNESHTYTATFVNGDTIVEERTLNIGEALGELPEAPAAEDGSIFLGWAATNADGEKVFATEETVITADTTFEAVFADKVHVKFQYSYKDAETGADIPPITAAECYVIPGEPLSTAMSELPVVELPGMRFGGWIEMFDDGTQTKVELDTVVTVDEGETEVVYSALLDTEISINFVYQDIMDSDDDRDTEEVITHAVYTMLPDNALSTAILMNADGTATEQTLSAIPVPPTFENYRFTGWYYNEGDAAVQLTEADLKLPAPLDTNFTGVYEKNQGYTVTFHDIDPDSKEKLPEGVESIDVLVPGGEALAGYLSEVALADRTADEVIKWYTLAEDGSKVEFDPTQPVTGDLDLYTYSFRIVLTLSDTQTASLLDILMPRAYAATVEIENGQLVVEFSDGEKLSHADFVKNGIDYTLYSWNFTNVPAGSGINSIDSLINYANNSMQPGDKITATGQAPNYDTVEQSISFYALVDGEWKVITTETVTLYIPDSDSHVHITANQLESIYGKFGFEASKFQHNAGDYTEFPFSVSSGWQNLYGSIYHVDQNNALVEVHASNNMYNNYYANKIFYMPAKYLTSTSITDYSSYYADYRVTGNHFHSITAKYEDGSEEILRYVLKENGTVTLNPQNGKVWKLAEGYENSCTLADDGLTITNATGPIVVEPAGDVFYTVKVIFGNGLLGVMPSPREQEVKSGENSTPVFLPTAPEGYRWDIPADATYDVADVENGQTYTFTNVRSDIVVELMKRQVFNVTISDPDRIFADVVLPTVDPVYEGDSFTVTLPIPTVVDGNGAEYSWFVDGVCKVNHANNGDGTLTYTVSNVMSDVKVEVSSGEIYTLIYHVNAPTAGWQETIDEVPTIAGAAEYTVTVQYNGDGTATYTLLSPSLTEVIRTVQGQNQTYKKSHFFDGWMSDQYGTEAQFKAEETALLSDIVALDTDLDKTIHLYGRWIDGATTQSLSYYVNLSGAMMTYDEDGAHASNNFVIDVNKGWTDGIYGTHMSITPMFTNGYDGNNPADIYDNGGVVLYDQTSTGKSNVDSEHTTDYVIRNNLKSADGVNAKYSGGVERNFHIGYVPSDEDVLRKLREMQATYIQNYESSGYTSPSAYVNANNKLLIYEDTDAYIPVTDLIPDNFSIKWYAVKYDPNNAWHIDGALIRKKAELIVQKTFYGDAEMISAVKGRTEDSKYYVSVTRNDRDATGTNYTLYLEDAEVNGSTYTWKLENVTGNRSYTVTEHNYFYDTEGKTTSAEYRVVNPTTGTSDIVSPGWHAYTDGVTVTTRAYADNETAYQTVQLINRYVPTDELLISKVDTQGEFLSGVSFQVKKGDSVVNFYPKDGKYHMEAIEGTNPVTTLTTDADGSIWIVLPETENALWNGTYTLIETHTPDEYNKIENVTFVVEDGKITSVTPVNTASVTNGNIMTVLNRSKTTNVAVQKNWTNAVDAKPVTLTLYKNGAAMPGMTVTLDGVVDGQETDKWYHRWTGLDLFAGGERIVYTVREDSIGSGDGIVNYDPKADATDGYADYIVSQNTKYYIYNNDENKYVETTDYVNATDVIVAVSNTLDKGNVTFLKTDGENPLANAKFTIYSNAACTDEVKSALSDATGMVTFTDLNPGVYYVMKETGVPEGYVENTTIYTVQVSGKGFKIIDGEGNEIDTIVNTPIPDVDLTVKKVDDDGNALDGSEFQIKCGGNAYLYEEGNTSKIVPLIANSANGDAIHTIKVETSTDTYTIDETTAPAGFYGMNGTISFKVTKGKVTDVSCPDGVQWDSNTNTFTVTNEPGVELPSTGGPGTFSYTIGGLLLMAASLLCGFGQRRKRERGDAI